MSDCNRTVYCIDCKDWFLGNAYESGDCNLGYDHHNHYRKIKEKYGINDL